MKKATAQQIQDEARHCRACAAARRETAIEHAEKAAVHARLAKMYEQKAERLEYLREQS